VQLALDRGGVLEQAEHDGDELVVPFDGDESPPFAAGSDALGRDRRFGSRRVCTPRWPHL
jgi:hypothetical protein